MIGFIILKYEILILFKMKKVVLLLILCPLIYICKPAFAQVGLKHRLIVLSDIGSDVDDSQSFIRLLLYSNEIDIKGLIATTSVWKKNNVSPEMIKRIIKAYGKVQPNLLKHEIGFPDANVLLKLVKKGLPVYGMQGVGKGKDSEGSNWIIKVLEEKDKRPLWIAIWGGSNTLAQALYEIKYTKPKTEAKRLISKLRVYAISDQDDSGIWIRNTFPDLFYIVSPGDNYGSATWSAINSFIHGVNNEEISNSWLRKNIQQGHGPLGAKYPDVAYGMEGDTPSWLDLIPNGLNAPEHPNWGGWGGRYELYKPDFTTQKKGGSGVPFKPETRKIWTNAVDHFTPFVYSNYGRTAKLDTMHFKGNKVTLWRWRNDFQNDFAARMAWCNTSYTEANHPPVPELEGSNKITVKSGEGIYLNASGSTDPDGDHLSFLWFSYPEAGTYKKTIITTVENMPWLWVIAPQVEKKETAHIILKVTDNGKPALSRYIRIIVTILPQ